MVWRRPGVLWTTVLVSLAGGAAAVPPCADLPPDPDAELAYRLRGDLCEGLYVRDTAGPLAELRLLSLTRGKIEFPWSEDTVLEVGRGPSPSAPVRVRAQPLLRDLPYRMDAVLGPGELLRWPASEVLYPARLTADRLGVLAWPDGRTPPVYVPVWVGEAPLELREAEIVALVGTSGPVGYLRWRTRRFSPERGRCESPGEWVRPEDRDREAGETIEIVLPGEGGEPFCLELHAREKGGDGGSLVLEARVIP